MSSTIYHFQYKKENHRKLSQICCYEFLFKGFNNEFETAVVSEPSVFEGHPKSSFFYSSSNCILNKACPKKRNFSSNTT